MEPQFIPGEHKITPIHKKIAIAAGLAILGVIIGVIVFATSGHDTTTTKPSANSPKFKNLLTPASEIKVGNSRYVSPCQVLPLASAAELFGVTNPGTQLTEDSLAVSRPQSDQSATNTYRTSCGYALTDKTVHLYADQYADASELQHVSSVFLRSEDKQRATIAAIKKTAGNDVEAKELASTFEKSLDKLNKYKNEYDDDKLKNVDFNGMMLPAYASNDVLLLYNNVVYSLDSGIKLEIASVEQLAKIDKAFKIITRNAANQHLDQSPAPTILGNTDMIGKTKILEPCVVLSTSVFQAITGQADNDLVERSTLPIDSNRDVVDKKVNKRVIVSNICNRNYKAGDMATKVGLHLYQAKTTTYAKQYVIDFHDAPSTPAPTPLQTSADEAFVFANSTDPASPTYLFRVGTYVGVISLETSDSTGADLTITKSSQDEHIRAINLLVENLKKQL